MRDISTITKEEFEKVYNKHLPSKWIVFAYKYFSDSTEKKDMTLRKWIVNTLLITFAILFFGVVFNLPNKLLIMFSVIYATTLISLVGYLFSAYFLNKKRIEKIYRELDVTPEQYNELVGKFY